MGKGRALKNGINYILQNYSEDCIIVTADSDGQHLVDDIKKCSEKCIQYPDKLILGCRDFNDKNVPYKSKFGNKLTRTMFKIFIGINITDTQTGLRAFSFKNAKLFLGIAGERFEYETNVLIAAKDNKIDIEEVKIKTVYINENKSTHFKVLKDSIIIYRLFLKYIFSSISSFFIDIIAFTIFYKLLFGIIDNKAILISTVMARIISSIYNYIINSKIVFKQGKLKRKQCIKYYMLVIVQMCLSAISVYLINDVIGFAPWLIKIIVDTILFITNFCMQREWIFNEKRK